MNDRKEITVSVILLTYNHAPYIRQAVESILRQQTAFPLEILIGDDCSTDGTDRIVEDYARQYPGLVIPVIRPENIGATANLYDLISRARGAYLAYLEGDDLWSCDEKLQRQVDFLREHPLYVGCTHEIGTLRRDGTPCREQIHWISPKNHYSLADYDGVRLPGHGNSLVHRNFFRDSEDRYRAMMTLHPMIADRMLALLLVSFGPVYRLPEQMGYYRLPAAEHDSATAVLFDTNPRRTLDDYLLTRKIESCAHDDLKIPADLRPQRRQLLFEALWTALRRPGKEQQQIAVQILRMEHSPAAIWFVFKSIAGKIAGKLGDFFKKGR